MALSIQTVRLARAKITSVLGLRWGHISALPSPFGGAIESDYVSPPSVLPEDSACDENCGIGFRSFSFGGSMELMAVPKRKTSPHKRGIRNGPKALKPIPVIVRCKCCGAVKLPHYYCCSGDRGIPGQQNEPKKFR